MLQESDLWVRLFGDPATKTVAQIKTLIDETRNLYDFLQGKEGAMKPIGFTDQQLEDLKKNPEALKAIQDAIRKLKQELGQKSPFDQFANEVKTGRRPDKKGIRRRWERDKGCVRRSDCN